MRDVAVAVAVRDLPGDAGDGRGDDVAGGPPGRAENVVQREPARRDELHHDSGAGRADRRPAGRRLSDDFPDVAVDFLPERSDQHRVRPARLALYPVREARRGFPQTVRRSGVRPERPGAGRIHVRRGAVQQRRTFVLRAAGAYRRKSHYTVRQRVLFETDRQSADRLFGDEVQKLPDHDLRRFGFADGDRRVPVPGSADVPGRVRAQIRSRRDCCSWSTMVGNLFDEVG